jgi:MoxR-like ATPase
MTSTNTNNHSLRDDMDGEEKKERRYQQFDSFSEKRGETVMESGESGQRRKQETTPPPPPQDGPVPNNPPSVRGERGLEGEIQGYSQDTGVSDPNRRSGGRGGFAGVKEEAYGLSYSAEDRYSDVPDAIKTTQRMAQKLMGEVKTAVLGKGKVLELVCAGLLSNGNILFEDFPGLAKTLIARSFAKALGCVYKRIQFTPDLLPADITGTYVFNRKISEFEFKKGPIFTNILLADEINRAPPKTQAALLEAMEEQQVSVEGTTHILTRPFHVVATQNPIEYEGTYPLPEAQLDRFIMKLEVGYPDANTEISILNHRKLRAKDDFDLKAISNPEEFTQMQRNVEKVFIDDSLIAYIVSIVRETRRHPDVKIGASPRGALAMFKLSRSMAALQGRDYVIPDDVKKIVVPALEHRLILKPEPKIKGIRTRDVVIEIVENIPVPLA